LSEENSSQWVKNQTMNLLKRLSDICSRFGSSGVKYVVIGGWAVILHGFSRTTEDIDIIVEKTEDNFERLKKVPERYSSRYRRIEDRTL